jgi:hypothetical protein
MSLTLLSISVSETVLLTEEKMPRLRYGAGISNFLAPRRNSNDPALRIQFIPIIILLYILINFT